MADCFFCRWQKKKKKKKKMHMKNPTELFQEWYTLELLLSQPKNTERQHFQGSIFW